MAESNTGAASNAGGESNTRLLIVDDDAAQMRALCETLEFQGYATSGYTSARRALDALSEGGFDVVLTDLKMPEMDGIALLEAAQRRDPDLVGIVMTGHATVDTAVDAMKAGSIDYVLKPFKLGSIMAVLTRALAVRRLRTENREMQQRIARRTEELESAYEELDAFSHSVSHDLRAPLRAIQGFCQIVIDEHSAELSAEVRRLLGNVQGGAQRMSSLIEDLLTFSRYTRAPMTRRRVDMRRLAGEALQDLSAGTPLGNAVVEVGELPEARGDAGLLKPVFTNLLSNALKFSRQRTPPRIEVGSLPGENEYIYFVRDNGAGFDMRYANRLFGVFQRLHTANQFEGTGVGLSIVRRIVKRHGGRVWAEGRPDEGATFYFSLPDSP